MTDEQKAFFLLLAGWRYDHANARLFPWGSQHCGGPFSLEQAYVREMKLHD